MTLYAHRNTDDPKNGRAIYGVDFAIVTALDVERKAIVRRLEEAETISEPDQPYTYYRGKLGLSAVSKYEIVVVKLLEAGNVDAAAATTTLIARWRPRRVLLVGIAGGVRKRGLQRGDVAVARYAHYYEPGKRTQAGEERRPRIFPAEQILLGKAQAYEADEWKDAVGILPPNGTAGFIPKAHFGPIAAGELVIADSDTLPQLEKEAPKLIAVAMEGAGVAQACASASLGFLEIRGISDLADAQKSDDWHEYAANAAAAFTFGFLRSVPVRSIEEQQTPAQNNSGPPVVAFRAQSQRQIRADELIPALKGDYGGREIETALLDLMPNEASGRGPFHPEQAVARLLDARGPLSELLAKRDEVEFVFHGLLHIPLAALIGFLFTDRLRIRFFDYHPTSTPASWIWPECDSAEFPPLQIHGLPDRRLAPKGDIVVRMQVSYPISREHTRAIVAKPAAEIDLQVQEPVRGVVRSERQVLEYGSAFRRVLDQLSSLVRSREQKIHLFYAGPVSLAFHVGQVISESIHPTTLVWNYRQEYEWAVDLAAAARGECLIEWARPQIESRGQGTFQETGCVRRTPRRHDEPRNNH